MKPHRTFLNTIQKFFVIFQFTFFVVLYSYFAIFAYWAIEATNRMHMEHTWLISEIIRNANPNYLKMRARKKEVEMSQKEIEDEKHAQYVMDTWCG